MRAGAVFGSVAVLVFAAGLAGGAETAGPPFDFTRSVGLFGDTREYGLVTELADTTLAPGDTLTLLTRFEKPDGAAPTGGAIAAIVVTKLHDVRGMNFNSVPGRAVYRLRGVPEDAAKGAIGMTLRAPPRFLPVRNGRVESDLDGDGFFERYSECASHEGLHFEIWEGVEPWSGEPLADIYHYFPFDLEPNCPGMELPEGGEPEEGDTSEIPPNAPSK
jgi:hypothetical protein